jgi:uncharacterized protein (TIGR03067 family)
MPPKTSATMALAAMLIGHSIPDRAPVGLPNRSPVHPPSELVGRWALIASIVDGEDITKAGITQAGAILQYTFKDDGTFIIAMGDSVRETGIWSTDATVSPKIFDHTWNTATGLGPMVHGIYESGGGILKVSMVAPTAVVRPTTFESKAANGSRIYIFQRSIE